MSILPRGPAARIPVAAALGRLAGEMHAANERAAAAREAKHAAAVAGDIGAKQAAELAEIEAASDWRESRAAVTALVQLGMRIWRADDPEQFEAWAANLPAVVDLLRVVAELVDETRDLRERVENLEAVAATVPVAGGGKW